MYLIFEKSCSEFRIRYLTDGCCFRGVSKSHICLSIVLANFRILPASRGQFFLSAISNRALIVSDSINYHIRITLAPHIVYNN